VAAVQESTRIVAAAEKAEAKIPAKLKHVAALQPVRYGRSNRRRVTRMRRIERHAEHRAEPHYHHRGRPQYTHERQAPRRPARARDHRRIRGHDRFAFEPHYRLARF
jgi:hypothetical protein